MANRKIGEARARTEVLWEFQGRGNPAGDKNLQCRGADALDGEPVIIECNGVYSVQWLRGYLGHSLADLVAARCRIVAGRVWGDAIINALREIFGISVPSPGAPEQSERADHHGLLTVKVAAMKLQISERTLLRLVKRGEIDAIDLNRGAAVKRLLRFKPESIASALVSANSGSSTPVARARFHG